MSLLVVLRMLMQLECIYSAARLTDHPGLETVAGGKVEPQGWIYIAFRAIQMSRLDRAQSMNRSMYQPGW